MPEENSFELVYPLWTIAVTARLPERRGDYIEIADEPVRATIAERTSNPRSRSAKLR